MMGYRFSLPLAGSLMLACATPVAAQEGPPNAADFRAWIGQRGNRASAMAFQRFLTRFGVQDVLPMRQLLRTATSWRACGQPFEVPPPGLWGRVVPTLRFLRDEIRPRIGAVEMVSGYRNPRLNRCAHGAPRSAHAEFWGVDLVPATRITQAQLFSRLCALHREKGRSANFGLGFYGGLRFHVDTKSYRLWGSNNRSSTSPCA
jgi:hypothetical protein